MITFVKTCWACPEQYDAFFEGKKVGYLRLRHGTFRVDYPDCGGENIYIGYPAGDGCFDEEERAGYLQKAANAIRGKLREITMDAPYEVVEEMEVTDGSDN